MVTKEQTEKMIEIMQAHVDGKAIQVFTSCEWHELSDPSWDFKNFEYRIKPTPLEKWVVVNNETNMVAATFSNKADAENSYYFSLGAYRIVHMKEVTDV